MTLDLLRQGMGQAWLFVPTAVLLGALHGLEPGHSKTMMAAFIVAVRGTVGQAVLLGLSATISHTLVVWVVALGGMYLWRGVDAGRLEPYFQLASAGVIVAIALWMLLRTWRSRHPWHHHHHGHHHHHDNDHDHDHHHHNDTPVDAHERAHAADIERHFKGQPVTTGQIVLFGLTGGLIPCPAAITVLLLCLQLKQLTAGVLLVLSFSIGLALTLSAVGMAAAFGASQAVKRAPQFDAWMQRAPYLSSLLIVLAGLYAGVHGVLGLLAGGA